MKARIIFLVQVCALVAVVCAQPGWAAEGQKIGGVVEDAQGRVVAGAEVALVNAQQAVLGNMLTDGQGRFVFDKAPAGSYLLRVMAAGFAESRQVVTVR